MAKTPSVKDYGGFNYDRNRRERTEISGNATHTFRCLDCGTMRHVVRKELNRAAHPRCLRCGGTLEQTKAEERRQLGSASERKNRAATSRDALADIANRIPCQSCGERFDTPRGLGVHLCSSSACAYEYRADGLASGRYYPGTVHINKLGKRQKWAVTALGTVAMQFIVLEVFPRLCDATDHVSWLKVSETMG